jgi:hypothetical protein
MPVLKDKQAGIFKIKVNVGEYFGFQDDELYVELREPTTEEATTLTDGTDPGNPSSGQLKRMFSIAPKCIINHNFLNEDQSQMTNKEVWDLIKVRSGCAMDIVSAWGNNIPLANMSQKQSAGSQNIQSADLE